MRVTVNGIGDHVCEHGTAVDVHCCNCHSGFVFDMDHECPPSMTDAAALTLNEIRAAVDKAFEIARTETKYHGKLSRHELARALFALLPKAAERAFPFDAWHEDDHDVLWWHFPIREPPYVGSPLASDWPFGVGDERALGWTRFVVPTVIGGGDK